MKKKYKLEIYGVKETIYLSKEKYGTGGLAIAMDTNDEPWDVLTVNLVGHTDLSPNTNKAFIEKDKYEDFVKKNNLGTPTGRTARSGYKTYVEYEFAENIY